MRIHEREQSMQVAAAELSLEIHKFMEKYPDLTSAEYLYVIQQGTQSILNGFIKIQLRIERHGDADTPSGLAAETEEI